MTYDSVMPDLAGTSCAVRDCFDPADAIAAADVTIPVITGAPRLDYTLDVPLCGEHQHLMRMGVDRFELETYS